MALLTHVLSRPSNEPFRMRDVEKDQRPHLDRRGRVAFGPGSDVEDPHQWSAGRRAGVTFCAVLLVLNATFASSAPSGCLRSMARDFDVGPEVAGLTMTLFLLGYCAGPLVFAPLSELYGRRRVFYASFSAYVAFNFLCAFAPTLAALLVGRFLTGAFVSAPLSNAPGLLADLWDPVERGTAMACFSVMVWIGPALGPVVAGFLELHKGWRWTFYVLLWLGAATWLLMLTIPETHGPTILRHKARRLRAAGFEHAKAPADDEDRSLRAVYRIALTRPWLILFDTVSLLCAIYLSVVYTLLYMLFSIYPIVFQERRGWNTGVGELPLIGTAVGAVLGGLVVVYDTRRRSAKMRRGDARLEDMQPEDRLPLAMAGGLGFAVTMFWLAWSAAYDSVHWIVPTLAGVFLSSSMLLIFVGFLNYLVDTYLAYAASAIAANTIARSACGAAAPLFTNQMFHALGIGGGGSLIGGVATVLAVILFLFYKYGRAIRIRSKYAPTDESDDQRAADVETANPADYALHGPSEHDDDDATRAPSDQTLPRSPSIARRGDASASIKDVNDTNDESSVFD